MQTKNILYNLKAQETALNVKIRKTEKSPSDELVVMGIFCMKFYDKILRSVCNALWMLHLFKTSIMITRTPLTTLKCMPKAIISQTIL